MVMEVVNKQTHTQRASARDAVNANTVSHNVNLWAHIDEFVKKASDQPSSQLTGYFYYLLPTILPSTFKEPIKLRRSSVWTRGQNERSQGIEIQVLFIARGN